MVLLPPTAPLQDLRSLPPPTDITSPPASVEKSPLPSWKHTSPITSPRPDFSDLTPTIPAPHARPVLPAASSPNVDINAIVQAVVQATLAANVASIATNPPDPSPAPTLTQPTGGHQTSASDNFFLKAWNGDQDSFPIFQARICAYFESPSFVRVTNFTTTLPGTKHQSSLLGLRLMSGLLPDKVLAIFLHNHDYEHDGFRMCGRILKKYDP